MKSKVEKFYLAFLGMVLSMQAVAQEKGLDVDIDVTKDQGDWYKQPWVWVVGGAVFILLLVAMLRKK